MKQFRIGVVGGGNYGLQMLKCFSTQAAMGRIELAGLADLSQELLDARRGAFGMPGYTDYVEMLDTAGLDAVAVATPDHLHAEIINAAAERGVHVLSQKPLDVDVRRTKALIERCADAGILLYVDFHKRFDPAHIQLRNDVAAGRFGQLQYGSVHMEDRIEVPTEWLHRWAAKSSPSWFLGVHFYDLVYFITGLKPVRLLASGYKGKLESLGLMGAWDSIQARVEYEGGFSVNYDLSWILPSSFPSIVNQGIRLLGRDGLAEVDSQARGYSCASSLDTASVVVNPHGALEYDHPVLGQVAEGYTFKSMTYFIDLLAALETGRSLDDLEGTYPDGAAALISTQIGEAIDRSIASGQIEYVVENK